MSETGTYFAVPNPQGGRQMQTTVAWKEILQLPSLTSRASSNSWREEIHLREFGRGESSALSMTLKLHIAFQDSNFVPLVYYEICYFAMI